jgi:hypothetical protein
MIEDLLPKGIYDEIPIREYNPIYEDRVITESHKLREGLYISFGRLPSINNDGQTQALDNYARVK